MKYLEQPFKRLCKDILKNTKDKSKWNFKILIPKKIGKRGKRKTEITKQKTKIKWQMENIPIITSNVNGLNTPIKRYILKNRIEGQERLRLAKWI